MQQLVLIEILAVPAEQSRGRHNPRVVKRKMSNFALKRDPHRHWPQPTKSPGQAVVVVARTARGP